MKAAVLVVLCYLAFAIISGVDAQISPAQIIANAQVWVNNSVPYDQGTLYDG